MAVIEATASVTWQVPSKLHAFVQMCSSAHACVCTLSIVSPPARVQIALLLEDDGLSLWFLVFWHPNQRSEKAIEGLEQLVLQQDDSLLHMLAKRHPDVRLATMLDHLKDSSKRRPPLLFVAHALAAHVSDAGSRRRGDYELRLSDTAVCRTVAVASTMLPDAHNVGIALEVDLTDNSKLGPQLATLRQFAGPYLTQPDGSVRRSKLPKLCSMAVDGGVDRCRGVPPAMRRLSRMLDAVNAHWLVQLNVCVNIGGVGMGLMAPSLMRLTSLTGLTLWCLESAGAAALAGTQQ